MTPFARFFLVMLFVIPVAYFAASWYNGEDPLNVRSRLGLEEAEKKQVTVQSDKQEAEATMDAESLQQRIDKLEKELQQCQQELKSLKSQVQNNQ